MPSRADGLPVECLTAVILSFVLAACDDGHPAGAGREPEY